ncbi:hypothetical protein [uncultured Mediterranean phage uvMED]|nr:hypothetical protein [uncultured Mediterranean phage uvMED]
MELFLTLCIVWLLIIWQDIKEDRDHYKNTLLMQQKERYENE